MFWLLYLAVEPYIRRFWPSTLVSWSRLLFTKQWRDPLVGRDILLGVGLGMLIYIVDIGGTLLAGRFGHWPPPSVPSFDYLLGTRFVLALVGNQVFNSAINALFIVFGLVLLKLLVRREWAAVLVAILLFTFTAARGLSDIGSRAVGPCRAPSCSDFSVMVFTTRDPISDKPRAAVNVKRRIATSTAAHSRRTSSFSSTRAKTTNSALIAALKTWLPTCASTKRRAEQVLEVRHRRRRPVAGRAATKRAADGDDVMSMPSPTPNRMSRPTSGSRHCRAIRRDHDTSVAGQKRRTYGSSAR